MNIRLSPTLVAAFAIAVIAAGCGGADDSTSASESMSADSSSQTKAEFIKQANAACNKAREGGLEDVAAYTEKHRSPGVPEAVVAAKGLKLTLLSIIEEETKALRGLTPPPGDEEEIEAMLADIQRDFEKAKKVKAKADLHPEEIEDKFLDVDKQIRAYGLSSCVK